VVRGRAARLAAVVAFLVIAWPGRSFAAPLRDLKVLFKLDPRLTQAAYMGERWLSPRTYTGTVGQDTVEVKVLGVDAEGRSRGTEPEWIPSDPEMVTVATGAGGTARIVVKRAGESTLRLTAQGLSRELAVKAELRNGALRVEITQPQASRPDAPAGAAPANKSEQPSAFNTPAEKRSYALGARVGESIRQHALDVDAELYAQGIMDALSGEPLMSPAEITAALGELREELKQKQMASLTARRQEIAAKNKEEGEAFLAGNKAGEGVVSLPSGLQYKILKAGDGQKPTINDKVACNYRGTLLNGSEFDSSYKRGKPATFAVARVIPGWREVLQLMPAGSRWQIFVPAHLGYGQRGAGKLIGPNATLIFELELLAVKSRAEEEARARDDASQFRGRAGLAAQ
jgi:FKBP-type peptidyl-prolyl cis-trans isomerase